MEKHELLPAKPGTGVSFSVQFKTVMKKNFLMLTRIRSIVMTETMYTVFLAVLLIAFGLSSTPPPADDNAVVNATGIAEFWPTENCTKEACVVAFSDNEAGCSENLINAYLFFLAGPCNTLKSYGYECLCQAPKDYDLGKVEAGIVFSSSLPALGAPLSDFQGVNYTIHAPSTTSVLLSATPFLPFQFWGNTQSGNTEQARVLEYFQSLADSILIGLRSGDTAFELSVDVQLMPWSSQSFAGNSNATIEIMMLFYPMLIFAMGCSGLASVIMREKTLKLDTYLFVIGIRETVHWTSWFAYGILRLLLSFVLVLIILLAIPIFPSSVDTSVLVAEYALVVLALVMYSLFVGVTNNSVAFVSSTFIIFLELQAGVAFLWHFDVVPNAIGVEAGRVLVYLFSIISVPFGVGIFTSIMYKSVLVWGFPTYGWAALLQPTPYGVTGLGVMICSAANVLLLLLGAIYLRKTMPNANNTQSHPCFCFGCGVRYRFDHHGGEARRTATVSGNGSPSKPVFVTMSNVDKSFGRGADRFKAVNNLNVQFFANEVCAFLGHNGSGKTTSLGMLTGLIKPERGRCTIDNTDILTAKGLAHARSLSGVCVQHNVQYPYLSVKENLELVARMRCTATNPSEVQRVVEAEVSEAIDALDLRAKSDAQAQHLSGGQKRKLTVAMSLVGNPKLILLDEPTANLDSQARHVVWRMVQERRKRGCTIILTTHHMDEAEILGDRVVVLSKGHVQVQGTSMQLKRQLDVGYKLVVSPAGTSGTAVPQVELAEMLRKATQGTALFQDRVDSTVGAANEARDWVFMIPPAHVAAAANVLDNVKGNGGVVGYGLTAPSLSDVFVKLCENAEQAADDLDAGTDSTSTVDRAPHDAANDIAELMQLEHVATSEAMHLGILYRQRWALAAKRCAMFVPAIILCIGLAAATVLAFVQFPEPPPEIISLAPSTVLQGRETMTVVVGWDELGWASGPAHAANEALLEPPITSVPVVANGSTLGITSFVDMENVTDLAPEGYLGAISISPHSPAQHFANVSVLGNATSLFGESIALTLADSAVLCSVGSDGGSDSCPLIGVSFVVLAQDEAAALQKQLSDDIIGVVLASVLLGLIITATVPSQISALLEEKVLLIKEVQLLTGVSPSAYWGANMLFDFTLLATPFAVFTVILVVGGASWLQGFMAPIAFAIVFLVGIPAILSVLYLLSWWAKPEDPGNGQLKILIPFMLGYIVFQALALLPTLVTSLDNVTKTTLGTVAMLHPAVAVSSGMSSIFMTSILSEYVPPLYFSWNVAMRSIVFLAMELGLCYTLVMHLQNSSGNATDPFRKKCGKIPLTVNYPDIEDADVAAERAHVERVTDAPPRLMTSARRNTSARSLAPEPRTGFDLVPSVDPSALLSAAAPDPEIARGLGIVTFANVGKIFPPSKPGGLVNVAVKSLSLEILNGECFALLGTNGAGKTTALNMLLGLLTPNYGTVGLVPRTRRQLGFCPQTNVFTPEFTARETLTFYGRLHGAVEPADFANRWLRIMYLEPYADVPASTFSGGNKRKLCLAVALCGLPEVCVLDEPSAGVDTKARADLWTILKAVRAPRGQQQKKTTLVLTTHFMDEADELASRIAIMVKGQLTCLGTPQHLKEMYASDYYLSYQVSDSTKLASATEQLLGLFKGSSHNPNRSGGHSVGCITLGPLTAVSAVFETMEEAKASLGLEYYTVGQDSMEQVFLGFARAEERMIEAEEQAYADSQIGKS